MLAASGCVGCVNPSRPSEVYMEPAVAAPVFREEDDYAYYPRYGMHYGRRSHRYYRQEGRARVATRAPGGVAVNALVSSPSLNVEFHDSACAHHQQVIKTHPRNWRPAGGNPGRKGARWDHSTKTENTTTTDTGSTIRIYILRTIILVPLMLILLERI